MNTGSNMYRERERERERVRVCVRAEPTSPARRDAQALMMGRRQGSGILLKADRSEKPWSFCNRYSARTRERVGTGGGGGSSLVMLYHWSARLAGSREKATPCALKDKP